MWFQLVFTVHFWFTKKEKHIYRGLKSICSLFIHHLNCFIHWSHSITNALLILSYIVILLCWQYICISGFDERRIFRTVFVIVKVCYNMHFFPAFRMSRKTVSIKYWLARWVCVAACDSAHRLEKPYTMISRFKHRTPDHTKKTVYASPGSFW